MIRLDPRPPQAFFGGHLPGSLSAWGPLGDALYEGLTAGEARADAPTGSPTGSAGGPLLEEYPPAVSWVDPGAFAAAAREGGTLPTVGELTPAELDDRIAAGVRVVSVDAGDVSMEDLLALARDGGNSPVEETADPGTEVVVTGTDPARTALLASLLLARGTSPVRVLVDEAPRGGQDPSDLGP